jgi:hypothetical protein
MLERDRGLHPGLLTVSYTDTDLIYCIVLEFTSHLRFHSLSLPSARIRLAEYLVKS